MASTELERSPSSTTNRKTWTFSAWVKRSKISSGYPRIFSHDYADTDRFEFFFYNTDELQIEHVNNNSVDIDIHTNRKFRDTNAWYHIVLAVDTTQNTAADRVKLYINGVQETSLTNAAGNAAVYPSQDTNTIVNYASGSKFIIGETGYSSGGQNFDGLMSHIHFVDGTALAPTVFGSTDSTTGEWKINTSPSFTPGTNGFTILKDGNTVTDQSANSNNFTVAGGTLTNTKDNPSNVFDTINTNFAKTGGVAGRDSGISMYISNGNTRLACDKALWTTMCGSIPMTTGKYYFECKRTYEGSPSNHLAWIGIEEISTAGTNLGSPAGTNTNAIAYYTSGSVNKSNSSQSGTWATWQSNNDIAMCAIDLDNNFIYFGVNGTWSNSGNPESGGSGTGGIAITAGKTYVTAMTVHRGGGSAGGDKTWLSMNFGNGYFQNTQVASAGTNASNLGIFEYNVPAGYAAICTKGLNE